MRKISRIILHCTATSPDWMEGATADQQVNEIRRWHLEKGWRDIGYHYLIDRRGYLAYGRPIEKAGAHTYGHNTDSIGIALAGGLGASSDSDFFEHFTPQQSHGLRALVADIELKHGAMTVRGHNEFSNKACPGFQVADWLRSGD